MTSHATTCSLFLCLSIAGCAARTSDPIVDTGTTSNVLALGAIVPGSATTFDVPTDALGFNIVVSGPTDSKLGIARLVSPSGVRVIDGYLPEGADLYLGLGSVGLGAFSVPQTDRTAQQALETGRWTIEVGGFTARAGEVVDKSGASAPTGDPVTTPLDVKVRLQRAKGGSFSGGALDLHVYVPNGLVVHDGTGTRAIDETQAATDAAIGDRIDLFFGELDRLVGVGRGAVSFHSIGEGHLREQTGRERTQLIQLADIEAQALHIVLTNDLGPDVDDPLYGVTLGTPAAVAVAGTALSAIAVALYPDRDAMFDAVTMLHEMGHFVGLLHSTEYDGSPDLLSDTPICSTDKACIDDPNLMNPSGPPGAAQLSPEQLRIFRGSPIYRAAP